MKGAEKRIQEGNKYEEVLKRRYSRKSEKKRIQEKKKFWKDGDSRSKYVKVEVLKRRGSRKTEKKKRFMKKKNWCLAKLWEICQINNFFTPTS